MSHKYESYHHRTHFWNEKSSKRLIGSFPHLFFRRKIILRKWRKTLTQSLFYSKISLVMNFRLLFGNTFKWPFRDQTKVVAIQNRHATIPNQMKTIGQHHYHCQSHQVYSKLWKLWNQNLKIKFCSNCRTATWWLIKLAMSWIWWR